jgi:non-specific protein-tyrosine kinase
MELLQYWKVIRKSLWLVVLICLLGLGAAAAYTVSRPAQYVSSTTLLLNPSVPSALVPYVQTQLAANLADSYTKVLHTRSFAESVSKELPFEMSPGEVGRAISTRLAPNTLFYEITTQTGSPEQAQQLLTIVLKVFLASDSQRAATQAGSDTKSETRKILEDEFKYLDAQVKDYETRIVELEAQPSSQERNDELLQLRGQLVALHQSRTDTVVALGQLGSENTGSNSALVIDEPSAATPVPSQLLRNLILALFVSLLLGVGLAFLRDYLDYTIHSPEYLEQVLGLAPMAAIGVVGEGGGRNSYGSYGRRSSKGQRQPGHTEAAAELAGSNLITLEHPKSVESESFRVLRTNIQFSSMDKPVQSLVVTSSGPGEGKSFTASNLAIVMSQAGKRVILVDTDLRKPNLHKVFQLPNQVGFTNLVLNRSVDVAGAIQPVPGIDNLAVVTSGPIPPNPSEVLNSQPAAHIMEALAQRSDMVIYDTPPAAAVTDAVIVGTRTDAVILVINAGTTRRDIVARVQQHLQKVGITSILPVLNRVRTRDLQGYYYYYSYYGTQHPDSEGNGVAPGGRKNGKAARVGQEAGRS